MKHYTYHCAECRKEEYWTRSDIYDGDYPPFNECNYCEQWVCDNCLEQHQKDEVEV